MQKVCNVCGRVIPQGEMCYSMGDNIYLCCNEDCFDEYYWRELTEVFLADKNHEYAIVNHKLYRIGSEHDNPKGMDGKHYTILFVDGYTRETTSLWFITNITRNKRNIFKNNAQFI